MVVLWPFLMLLQRFISEWKAASSSTAVRFSMETRTNIHLVVSARAHIIEVAIESSFQPLLQLYLLLPFLIKRFSCALQSNAIASWSLTDLFGSVQNIQFWSIFTSILSLAWSFTYYQSTKKRGALDFGANALGRMLLLLANFLQICGRLLALVLYAYCFGPGNFWPMIVSVVIHIIVMSVLHYWMSFTCKANAPSRGMKNIKIVDRFVDKFKTIYHCLINGICNLYLHNEIMKIETVEIKTNAKQASSNSEHHGTFSRQVVFDAIFFVENLAAVILSYITLPSDLPVELLLCIMASQLLGLIMKWVYYRYFHIWRNAFSLSGNLKLMSSSCKRLFTGTKVRDVIEPQASDGMELDMTIKENAKHFSKHKSVSQAKYLDEIVMEGAEKYKDINEKTEIDSFDSIELIHTDKEQTGLLDNEGISIAEVHSPPLVVQPEKGTAETN